MTTPRMKKLLAELATEVMTSTHVRPERRRDVDTVALHHNDLHGVPAMKLIHGGRVLLPDALQPHARIRVQAEEAIARLAAANAETRALAEKLSPYVNQYCSGLASSSLSGRHA